MSAAIITRLAARGDGVTADGHFVPMTAPGDGIAEDGSIVPGPHHADPPCRHFPECGGCQLQHVDDVAYADYLRDRIASALAAQRVGVPDILEPYLSPPRSRRRATLKAAAGYIGFHAAASHRIVDMRECHILRPELFALVAPMRRLLKARVRASLTLADQGVDLLLEGVSAEGLDAAEALSSFASEQKLARLAIDDGYGAQTLWEPEPVTVTLSGVAVTLPHGGFLQATMDGEAALVAAVRSALGEAENVADLFAGLGTFALAMGGRVHAAEGARDAALALRAAADRARRPIFVEHRDLFRNPLDEKAFARFDAVLLDPPRAGAHEQAARLAGSEVERLVYVSCNPATFARDARTLAAGAYRLEWIKPVGQFRWSTHVELVAAFRR